ncbi:Ig-like domain-containing protein [Fictibacillus nanhaiensis]|uniref:Ig-like domain-containing protein n=1 Tax=Fictibacillus nanhaiensis TaxID=742169 RepID=UPI002E1FA182|nr:Ig-like domain-containing protein [Fictibacillus nanhaiensis]
MSIQKLKELKTTIIMVVICTLSFQPIVPGVEAFAASMVDSVPPEIESIEVMSQDLSVGETVKIKAHLKDNQSGVQYINLGYQPQSKNKLQGIYLVYNEVEKVWEGEYTVKPDDENGVWSITWIDLSDNAGNRVLINGYNGTTLPDKNLTNFIVENENGDSFPPEITSIEVSPKTAKPGEKVTVKAKINDNQSGVKYINLGYQPQSKNKLQGIELFYNNVEQVWEGEYTVKPDDENGVWSITWIDLSDNAGNRVLINGYNGTTLPDKNLTNFIVENENGDSLPPEITSMEVSPKTAKPGEKVTVKAKINDNQSGIQYINLGYQPQSKNKLQGIQLFYNDVEQVWEGNYTIKSVDEDGVWSITWIDLSDNAGNRILLNGYSGTTLPDKNHTDFTVDSQPKDTTPPVSPTVEDITDQSTTIKGSAEPGSTVSVKSGTEELGSDITAEDGTFTISIPLQKAGTNLSIAATDKAGNSSAPKSVTVIDVTKPEAPVVNEVTDTSTSLTGTAEARSMVSVQSGTEEIGSAVVGQDGNFTISIPYQLTGTELIVEVKDEAGNVSDATKIVVIEDENSLLESITVNKNEVTKGETVQVSVRMKDHTGISYLNAYYSSPVTSQNYTVRLDHNPLTGSYEGSFPINSYFETGTYKLTMLSTYGTLGIHSIHQYEDPLQFEKGDIVVSGTAGINVIESITLDKKEVAAGETLAIKVKTSQKLDVHSMILYYDTPVTHKNHTITLTYNPETDVYEGVVTAQSNFDSGVYQMDMLSMYGPGVTNTLYNWQYGSLFDTGDFTVSGTSGKDVIENIKVINKELTAGDTMNVSVNVTDHTDIRYMNLYYESPENGKNFTVGLHYNSESNAFEGSMPIEMHSEGTNYNVYMMTIYYTFTNTAGLYNSYYGDLFHSGDFKVYTEENPPTFTSLSIDKKVAEAGDKIGITVEAADDTHLQEATVHYTSPKSKEKTSIVLNYDSANGKFLGNFIATETTEIGNWLVDSIEIVDTNQNSTIIDADASDLSNGTFTINEKDVQAPSTPEVDEVNDKSAAVSGKAEAGSTVSVKVGTDEIGSTTAGEDGTFDITIPVQKAGTKLSVTATDKAGNISEAQEVVVKDATNPEKPVVNEVTDKSTSVKGKAEAGSTVSVKVGTDEIGSTSTKEDESFNITIPHQKAGTKLIVTATDKAGNKSEAREVVVKDATSPEKPVVDEVTDKTIIVTGTAEVVSTVSIKVGTKEIDSTSTKEDGSFNIQIPVQKAGTKLSVTATDKAGNKSAAQEVVVSDATNPEKPVANEVTDKSTSIKGNAEVDSTVSVKKGTFKIGSTIVKEDGTFSIVIPAQKAGTKLSVTATDKAGNKSEVQEVVVKDATNPEKPVANEVTDKSTSITGKAEASSTVSIKLGTKEIGSTSTKEDGSFNITIPLQKAGTKLTVTATDIAGNKSEAQEVVVKDATSPEKPVVNKVPDNSTTVTGNAEADSTVSIKVGTKEIGSTTAKEDGTINITIPLQKAGTKLIVQATDKAGNKSEVQEVVVKDATSPEKPVVDEITDKAITVTGTAEADSTVSIKVGTHEIGLTTGKEDGAFYITIPLQKAGTKLTVTATDKAGNISEAQEIVVKDATSPQKPVVDEVTDKLTIVTGKAEADSIVSIKVGTKEIGSTSTKEDGTFSITIPLQKAGTKLIVTATDKAGNKSEAQEVVVKDTTNPEKPVVNDVTDKSTSVKGIAEAGSTVSVKVGTDEIGSTTAKEDGTFSIAIPVQKAGTKLSITATDKVGNKSEKLEVVVKDVTSPETPVLEKLTDKSTTIIGKAEAGSNIIVYSGTVEFAKTIVGEDGNFNITIPLQKAGTKLTIITVDQTGNKSERLEITVKDAISPEKPTVNEITNKSTNISGTAEAGSNVSVQSETGELGSSTAAEDGSFIITIPVQTAETKLMIQATDTAGNQSTVQEIIVKKASEPIGKFTDSKGHWAENEINKLYDLGLVKGYTDGSFGVGNKITRGEVASIISRHLKLAGTPSTFSDVPSNYWAANAIGAIQANNIMSGYNNGTFKPNAPITRAEIASIIERAYDLKGEKTISFTDVKATHWAYKPISVLVYNNLTSGFSDNTFRPNAELSRAEFAAFLSRIINLNK